MPGAGAANAPIRLIRQAVTSALPTLEGARPGRLVSLSIPLPADAAGDLAAYDVGTRWLSPAAGMTLLGRGRAWSAEAVGTEEIERLSRRLEDERADWQVVDLDVRFPPHAFFTHSFPQAGFPARVVLWVPTLLAQQRHGETMITLTARRTADAPLVAVARRWLNEAERMLAARAAGRHVNVRGKVRRIDEDPDQELWLDRVRATIAAIAAGRFDKAVLARRVTALLPGRTDLSRIVAQLARRYPDCNVFALPHEAGHVVAASPERLAVKHGSSIVSHALAGTVRRDPDPLIDEQLARQLLDCPKERSEHAFVVEAIAATLHDICRRVSHPKTPTVMRLRHVQHLWTPVSGWLRPGTGLLDAVARLHPTPAVAGFPRQAAVGWLDEIGERRGGCYTGAAGWIDAEGDGEAAVVLRSAFIEDDVATLWAGAGIVAQSQPWRELAETEMKLAALLEVLTEE